MTIAERLIQQGVRIAELRDELIGELRCAYSIARKLFVKGTPIAEVHELTKLPLEVLKELESLLICIQRKKPELSDRV